MAGRETAVRVEPRLIIDAFNELFGSLLLLRAAFGRRLFAHGRASASTNPLAAVGIRLGPASKQPGDEKCAFAADYQHSNGTTLAEVGASHSRGGF